MTTYGEQASWILVATFALSLAYEFYRATAKKGVSQYDSMRGLTFSIPLYIVGFGSAALARVDAAWAAWIVMIVVVVLILVSIFYYNPVMMLARKPGPIDWFEDLVYTGLLFVVAFLMAYSLLDTTLIPLGG